MKPVKSGYLITAKINMEFSKLEHSYTVGKGSQLGREILFVFFKCLRSSCWTIRNKTVFLALIKVLGKGTASAEFRAFLSSIEDGGIYCFFSPSQKKFENT